jgi:hypothetical protein
MRAEMDSRRARKGWLGCAGFFKCFGGSYSHTKYNNDDETATVFQFGRLARIIYILKLHSK